MLQLFKTLWPTGAFDFLRSITYEQKILNIHIVMLFTEKLKEKVKVSSPSAI
jgi:hypothetical protein